MFKTSRSFKKYPGLGSHDIRLVKADAAIFGITTITQRGTDGAVVTKILSNQVIQSLGADANIDVVCDHIQTGSRQVTSATHALKIFRRVNDDCSESNLVL